MKEQKESLAKICIFLLLPLSSANEENFYFPPFCSLRFALLLPWNMLMGYVNYTCFAPDIKNFSPHFFSNFISFEGEIPFPCHFTLTPYTYAHLHHQSGDLLHGLQATFRLHYWKNLIFSSLAQVFSVVSSSVPFFFVRFGDCRERKIRASQYLVFRQTCSTHNRDTRTNRGRVIFQTRARSFSRLFQPSYTA